MYDQRFDKYNFSLQEMLRSQKATREGIINIPTEAEILNMLALIDNVLQPVRDHYGTVVHVSSGFRIWTRDSQHGKGEAADFEITGIDNLELAKWIRDNLEFDQLISEFYEVGDPDSGWVHCSWKITPMDVLNEGMGGFNRNEVLTAQRINRVVQYTHGLA